MRHALTLLTFILPTTGCTIETVTTDIQVRDPARASLVRTDVTGSVQVPLPADGRITLLAPAEPSITLGLPNTIARWCTMVSHEPRGEKPKYSVVEDPKCVDSPVPGSVEYALNADWSDVRIVEHHRPDHAGAWFIIGLSTVAYGALAAFVFLSPASGFKGGATTKYALGATTTAIGAGFDLAMLPTLFTANSDIVIHDFGPPRHD